MMKLTGPAILRTVAVAGALSAMAIALPARGADVPALRTAVSVEGPIVTLGDLVEGAGDKAGIAVFRAPEPGTSGTVSADRILSAAAEHGLAALDATGIAAVSVSRLSRRIGEDDVARAVSERMWDLEIVTDPDDAMVDLSGFGDTLHIEASADGALRIESFEYDRRSAHFSGVLAVSGSRILGDGIRISGRAVRVVEVPVLARDIGRDEIIAASDIVIERVPLTTVRGNHIASPEDLVGFQARRGLRAGEPLSPGSVTAPVLVKRNDVVTVVYRVPGLTLTARGRSLGAGAKGDIVAVVNSQSSRTFEAEVVGHNQVAVIAAPHAAAVRTAAR